MNKLPWAKYQFSIWIVAILISLVAKYITSEILLLLPLSIAIYWFSVKCFTRINGYQ